MKVWIVWSFEQDSYHDELDSVWSSEQAAMTRLSKLNEEWQARCVREGWHVLAGDQRYSLEAVDVDARV